MSANGWLLLGMIAIVIACVLVVVILIFELLRVINELEYINSRQTNAELTSATRWPVIRRLVAAVNHSLVQSRNLRAQQTQQEAQIHQLLTNLTHDIKTPLTVASGYVQLMQRDAPDSQRLVRIAHNLTAVNYYVRYLMDFDVVQEQSNKLDLAEINLTTLVQEQLFDVFDDLNEKHLQLKPSLGTNIKLISDASLITRILQNLIGNWLKYATENVRVSLREKDATHIELTLANQTAVPVENIDHLVERFYTNDVARSDSKGLGLSIVANLMTRLNGTLGLSVEDGWFTVTLVFRRTDH